MNFHY